MKELENILKKLNIKYEIGIINNDHFYSLDTPFEDKCVIKIQWIKQSLKSLFDKLNKEGVFLQQIFDNDYYGMFKLNETDNDLLIEYVVRSHVQLPRVLLNNFRTNDDLYVLSTNNSIIRRTSASKYNTEKGYYSKLFEHYLSQNYESIISELISTIVPLAEGKVKEVELSELPKKIQKLIFMAVFRDPDEVKEINKKSITSVLIKGGLSPERIALMCEELSSNILDGFKPLVVINTLEESFVTLKSLISNLSLKDFSCIFLPLHPKFGIVMYPNKYYKEFIKEHGTNACLLINDSSLLNRVNLNIYYSALKKQTDVIGKKEDLDKLLLEINKSK